MTDNYELFHYGVKGMKWGVRREAKRDAKEAARAKMAYGEGAGNRRKLINKSVEAKAKRDPQYKEAFDYYSEKQDLSKAAKDARKWRKSQDTKKNVKRFGNGVAQALGATSLVALAGGLYASHYKAVNDFISQKGNDLIGKAKDANKRRVAANWMKKQGF